MLDHRSPDRRVRKTRGRLHAALASLIHQKPYDDIVVKEILARADVGRSTFYAHFRDKDALLVSGIHDLLRAGDRAPLSLGSRTERLLRFSLPMFEHLERAAGPGGPHRTRQHAVGQHAVGQHAVVHARLRDMLVEQLEAELREGAPGRREPVVPAALLARHVAATFVLVLEWWAEDGMRVPAREADARFRALVLPALTDALSPAAAATPSD